MKKRNLQHPPFSPSNSSSNALCGGNDAAQVSDGRVLGPERRHAEEQREEGASRGPHVRLVPVIPALHSRLRHRLRRVERQCALRVLQPRLLQATACHIWPARAGGGRQVLRRPASGSLLAHARTAVTRGRRLGGWRLGARLGGCRDATGAHGSHAAATCLARCLAPLIPVVVRFGVRASKTARCGWRPIIVFVLVVVVRVAELLRVLAQRARGWEAEGDRRVEVRQLRWGRRWERCCGVSFIRSLQGHLGPRTFATPEEERRMLSGLMSRCTTWRSWQHRRPRSRSRKMWRALLSEKAASSEDSSVPGASGFSARNLCSSSSSRITGPASIHSSTAAGEAMEFGAIRASNEI